MASTILKRFLPRGFYGRSALILLVPVVSILLIGSYAVIQRHYEGVTRQMTGIFARTVTHVLTTVDAAPNAETAADQVAQLGAAFDLQIRLHPVGTSPPADGAPPGLMELSDRVMLTQLRRAIAGLQAAALNGSTVTLWLNTRHGPLSLRVAANTVSPRNPHQLLVVLLLGGVLMGAIGFLFLKNQVRPILRLARAAEAFGLGQSVPFRPSGAREVRAAGQAFLEMRDRIEHHIEQRTLMLSGVSHDLRTPLTRLRLALSMAEDETEAKAMLADISQMEALIERLLDFARAEADETIEKTDLTALVSRIVERMARGDRPVSFLTPSTTGPLIVALRPHLFARALDNLIDNALRYGCRAEVRILTDNPEEDGVVVEVEDDGPGIDSADRAAAIRPFVRLDKARGAGRGAAGQDMAGVGLGLAIAADAMRNHGGQLELASGQTPGLGGLLARLVLPGKDCRPARRAHRDVATQTARPAGNG